MQGAKQGDLAVQEVCLDRARAARKALPRRAASRLAFDWAQATHDFGPPFVHLALGSEFDAGRSQGCDALRSYSSHQFAGARFQSAERLHDVCQVLYQLRMLQSHDGCICPRVEPCGSQCAAHLLNQRIDAGRVASGIENPRDRRSVHDHFAGLHMCCRQHHHHRVEARKAAQSHSLVGDAVLRANHDRITGGLTQLLECPSSVLRFDGEQDYIIGLPVDLGRTAGRRDPKRRGAVRRADRQSLALHRLEMRPARDEHDIVSALE